MASLKPYFIRAVYDWIVDHNFTPYLLVNAESKEVIVPRQYIHEGKIILNLRPQAVQALSLGNQDIAFSARFGGHPMQVSVPIKAVLAIYAQENGKGMVFDEEDEDEDPPPLSPNEEERHSSASSKKQRPALKVVK